MTTNTNTNGLLTDPMAGGVDANKRYINVHDEDACIRYKDAASLLEKEVLEFYLYLFIAIDFAKSIGINNIHMQQEDGLLAQEPLSIAWPSKALVSPFVLLTHFERVRDTLLLTIELMDEKFKEKGVSSVIALHPLMPKAIAYFKKYKSLPSDKKDRLNDAVIEWFNTQRF